MGGGNPGPVGGEEGPGASGPPSAVATSSGNSVGVKVQAAASAASATATTDRDRRDMVNLIASRGAPEAASLDCLRGSRAPSLRPGQPSAGRPPVEPAANSSRGNLHTPLGSDREPAALRLG